MVGFIRFPFEFRPVAIRFLQESGKGKHRLLPPLLLNSQKNLPEAAADNIPFIIPVTDDFSVDTASFSLGRPPRSEGTSSSDSIGFFDIGLEDGLPSYLAIRAFSSVALPYPRDCPMTAPFLPVFSAGKDKPPHNSRMDKTVRRGFPWNALNPSPFVLLRKKFKS